MRAMPMRPEQVVDDVAHTLGELMRFWGFRDVLGRIWGLLYLSPEPVTPEKITQRLKISRGNVSLALQEMHRWGAVRRVKVKGQLAKGYVAETDLWALITRVYRERERYEAERARESFSEAVEDLKQLPAADKAAKAYIAPRIERLQSLSGLVTDLLDQATRSRTPNPLALSGLLLKVHRELKRKD